MNPLAGIALAATERGASAALETDNPARNSALMTEFLAGSISPDGFALRQVVAHGLGLAPGRQDTALYHLAQVAASSPLRCPGGRLVLGASDAAALLDDLQAHKLTSVQRARHTGPRALSRAAVAEYHHELVLLQELRV